MYVYNLIFKFPSTDGLFIDQDVGAAPIDRSKTWLRLNANEPEDINNINPAALEHADWEVIKGIPTVPRANAGAADPANVWVRVAPSKDGERLDRDAALQFAVCFGRPPKPPQDKNVACPDQASPFTEAGNVKTTMISNSERRPDGADGWFFPLGTVDNGKRPAQGAKRHRYEFAVGTILTTKGDGTLHYGEDPEMDVGP